MVCCSLSKGLRGLNTLVKYKKGSIFFFFNAYGGGVELEKEARHYTSDFGTL